VLLAANHVDVSVATAQPSSLVTSVLLATCLTQCTVLHWQLAGSSQLSAVLLLAADCRLGPCAVTLLLYRLDGHQHGCATGPGGCGTH
jgi:hypothetical protein